MPHRDPIIGIGPHLLDLPKRSNVVGTYRRYLEAVEKAGGIAVILPPDHAHAKFYAQFCDGLLLPGGGDIHPRYYGAKLTERVRRRLSPDERTRFDLALVHAFLRAGRPILGICLGAQTLNVAFGGTLVRDLPTERRGSRDHTKGIHSIRVDAKALLGKVLGTRKLRVNSHHHQAIDRLGKGLRIVATASDGIIEAVEAPDRRFVFGVQWHPERLKAAHADRLFRAFVRSCSGGKRL
ncbi:MAG: gamma-glutamyl-gamma-aminobutyrate hydrolase family protein [Pseudomonadota bacterium]